MNKKILAVAAVIPIITAIMNDTNSRKRSHLDEDNEDDDLQNNNSNTNNTNNVNQDDFILIPPPPKKQKTSSPVPPPPPLPIPAEVITGLENSNNNENKYNEPLVLNVGGIHYYTSLQTVCGYHSMLKARFSTRYSMKSSKDGSYFIDRDGTLFKYILEYLRNGELILPANWTKIEIWRFYNEIKYFAIDSLFDIVLLKLFNSNIMNNPTVKLKLIERLMRVFDITSRKLFLEGLMDWKLIYEYDYKNIKLAVKIDGENQDRYLHNSDVEASCIGSSLFLAQGKNCVYGMYLQTSNNYYKFAKSFAFNVGDNSYHIIRNIDPSKVEFEYFNVRKATEDEAEIDETTYSVFGNNIYPFLVRRCNSGKVHHGSFTLTDLTKDEGTYGRNVIVQKLEYWSIPWAY